MTDTAPPEQKRRLFFAFELSDDVRKFATEAQSTLIARIGPREVRWTQPADMHITALFLGDHPNDRLPQFEQAGATAVETTTPFDFAVGGLGRFPPSGPPRVLWMGGHEPAGNPASALIASLRRALADIELDKKSFKPHITLGYVKPQANRRAIEIALSGIPSTTDRTLAASRLVLMQTIPEADRRKSGIARYNIVQVFPFQA